MTLQLAGMHDWSPDWARMVRDAGMEGWCVTTHALSEQDSYDFRPMAGYGVVPIARLNWGYYPAGTIPDPSRYGDFARRCAHFVAASPGCTRWIIGNESNHSQERPQGQPITAAEYAACYYQCRQAIHAVPGHERDEVIVAPVAPWNMETGDWLIYWAEVLAELLHDGCDALAIHTYTHGSDPALIYSTATMDPPYEDRYYHFLAYQDLLAVVPPALRRLPVYLTETDQDIPWTDVNDPWIQNAVLEIDSWNRQAGTQKIHCCCVYRWSGDRWALEGKQNRLQDFAAALALGIESPGVGAGPIPPTPVEPPGNGDLNEGVPGADPRQIDPALVARGVTFDFAHPPAGTGYWRLIEAVWLDEQEADAVGPDHHILGNVMLDGIERGGIPLLVRWPSGETIVTSKSRSPSATYNYDFPMSPSLHEFSIRVSDGNPSDSVSGIGMGADGNPRLHTSTWLDFEWVIAETITPPEPGPEPPEPEPEPDVKIVHPLPGARVTQHWGQESPEYAPGIWGHDGTDLGGELSGTPIGCIADGEVAWADFDAGNERNKGYGYYVRIYHEALACHSFYCHLAEAAPVSRGERVQAGQTIGLVGSTGNSTAAHLHLEIRLASADGGYDESCAPMPAGRCDPETFLALHGVKL